MAILLPLEKRSPVQRLGRGSLYVSRGGFWAGVINPFIATPEIHKYDQLLVICIAVLVVGFVAGAVGLILQQLLGKALDA